VFARQPFHLSDQALYPPRFGERLGRLRLGVLFVAITLQTDQASDLVLLVLGLMHTGATSRCARPQASAIDLDGRHLRRGGHSFGQLPSATLDCFLVPLLGHFSAHLVRKPFNVTRTDGDASEAQGVGSVWEGR